MIFVCLAHFTDSYHFQTGAEAAGAYLLAVAMLASPTFMIVSGSVTGFLSVTRSNSFDYLRRRLIDRGVFLLLIGHPILASSGWFNSLGIDQTIRRGYITDVIAISVIIGPTLVTLMRPRLRLLLAAVLFSLDWVVILTWTPHSHAAELFKHYFIGIVNPDAYGITFSAFPVIPWFALYLVGTCVGERLGVLYRTKGKREGHLFLARMGLVAAALGVLAKATNIALKHSPTFPRLHPDVMRLLSSYQKFPPSPTYLLFYAGFGLLIVAAVFEAERRGHVKFLIRQLHQMGEASLVVYAVQFYVYTVFVRALPLPYSPLWPILFLATLAFLAMSATFWNTYLGNQLLTVGLTSALNRRAARRAALQAAHKPSVEKRTEGKLADVSLSTAPLHG